MLPHSPKVVGLTLGLTAVSNVFYWRSQLLKSSTKLWTSSKRYTWNSGVCRLVSPSQKFNVVCYVEGASDTLLEHKKRLWNNSTTCSTNCRHIRNKWPRLSWHFVLLVQLYFKTRFKLMHCSETQQLHEVQHRPLIKLNRFHQCTSVLNRCVYIWYRNLLQQRSRGTRTVPSFWYVSVILFTKSSSQMSRFAKAVIILFVFCSCSWKAF